MSRCLFTAVVLGAATLMLVPLGIVPAQTILIDDFPEPPDDGWTHYFWPPTFHEGVFPVENGEYFIRSTEPVPPAVIGSYWDASEDPDYSNGYLKLKVRGNNADGGFAGGCMRAALEVDEEGAYCFMGRVTDGLMIYTHSAIGEIKTYPVPGVTFNAGEDWIIEGGVVEDLLSIKVWRPDEPEPRTPQLTVSDPHPLPPNPLAVSSWHASPDPIYIDATFDDIYFTFPVPGDFDSDRVLDVQDIDLLTREIVLGLHRPRFDLNDDEFVDRFDHDTWVHDLKNTWIGDANLDGEFNSSDMVQVFAEGMYEKTLGAACFPTSWAAGAWDSVDRCFTSSDMVAAFVDGGYEKGPRTVAAAVPEPMSVLLLMAGLVAVAACRHRFRT